jgi:hypothetical protein
MEVDFGVSQTFGPIELEGTLGIAQASSPTKLQGTLRVTSNFGDMVPSSTTTLPNVAKMVTLIGLVTLMLICFQCSNYH